MERLDVFSLLYRVSSLQQTSTDQSKPLMRQTTFNDFDDSTTLRRSLTISVNYTPKMNGMRSINSHFCVRLAESICDGLLSRQDIKCNHGRLFESSQKKLHTIELLGLQVLLNGIDSITKWLHQSNSTKCS